MAEQVLASQPLSTEAAWRIRARLRQTAPARSDWRWGAVALAGAALMLVVLSPWRHDRRGNAPVVELGGLRLIEGDIDARLSDEEVLEIKGGRGVLFDERTGITLRVAAPASLRREAGAVRVLAGTVAVSVAKRAPGSTPVRVLVSGGAIEVMGTRFIVEQREETGRVSLQEGAIAFEALAGQRVTLSPGEQLAWPLAPVARPTVAVEAAMEPTAPAEAVAPVRPTHPRNAAPLVVPFNVDALLEEVDILRRQHRYEDAVRTLSNAPIASLSPVTRERLSFEVGTLLSYQIVDTARACAHWTGHRSAFPRGRYDVEIVQAVDRLHCPSEP